MSVRIALNAARALVTIGALAGLSGMALAQGAPPPQPAARPAAKPAPRAKAPAAITVTNGRGMILTAFQVVGADGKAVGSLTKPLPAGKAARLGLKGAKGCTYTVAATFEDESEPEDMALDLCKDPKVRLVD